MTKAVQRRKGTNSEHSTFTGLEAEITVNTTNQSVHVHDGSTAGGYELARADGSNVNDFAVGGNLTVTGNTTINGTLTLGDADTDSITINADLTSNLIPNADDTYDIGSATKEWKDIYIDGTAYIDALNFNGTTITATGAELNYVDGVTSAIQTQIDGKQDSDAQLTDIAGLTPTDGNFIVGDGANFVAESGATARTSLGLGSIATQDSSSVSITGGSIDGVTIGGSTAGAITGTTITANTSITGTLATAAQPNITSVGTLTGFTSTGIDDNATSTAITIDSSQNVGIGVSPSTKLEIKDTVPVLRLNDDQSKTWVVGDEIAKISFYSSDASGIGAHETGFISNITEVGSTSLSGALVFGTAPYNTAASEVMRIDDAGNVGIGTSSPAKKLSVKSDGGGSQLGIDIHNEGTATGDDSVISFETQGSREFTMGLDRSATSFVIAEAGDLNSNQRLVIDDSGNVGMGISNPSGILHLYKASGTTDLRIQSNQYSANYGFVGGALGTNALGIYDYGASAYRFVLDSSGNVGINKTPTVKLEILGSASNAAAQIQVGTNGYPAISFLNAAAVQQGYIATNASSVSYTSVSDYRLKENVTYDWDATTRLKQLKPARFNFIADADTTVDGFLAHEVSSIIPEAVSGEKDAVDSEGNAVYQGIDQSKLVPLLVKTIQELEARITALEGN